MAMHTCVCVFLKECRYVDKTVSKIFVLYIFYVRGKYFFKTSTRWNLKCYIGYVCCLNNKYFNEFTGFSVQTPTRITKKTHVNQVVLKDQSNALIKNYHFDSVSLKCIVLKIKWLHHNDVKWARGHKSPKIWPFAQQMDQFSSKGNIKTSYTAFREGWLVYGGLPAQRANNTKSVSMLWHHHITRSE